MKCNKIIEFLRDGGRQFIMSLNKAWEKTKEKDKYDKVWEIIKKKIIVNMEKKYELIPSDKEGFYRIKALKDFNDVKKGDIGGYIEGEKNLSHDGNCWIYDNAIVCDSTQICGNAVVYGNAQILNYAQVCDNAKVWDNAVIQDNAIVCDNAKVCGNAVIRDNARVFDNAVVHGNARVFDNAQVYNNAKVFNNAVVWGNAVIQDNASVRGNAEVCGNAKISSGKDYIIFKNWWSSGRFFTWTRSNNMWKVGCFYGTGDELIAKAYEDGKVKGREYERIVKYVEGEDKHYTQTLEKTWKPTQKQLNAIKLAKSFVTDDFGANPTLSETLNELLEQLKKLRE